MAEHGVEKNVLEWLHEQGYPLELATGAAFREAGLSSFVSYFYGDPEAEKYRQIDVLAWTGIDQNEIEVKISFVVECKASIAHPWVYFVDTPARPYTALTRTNFLLGTPLMPFFMRQIMRRRPDVGRSSLFGPIERLGYGTRTAFAKADIAYQAVMSVLSAAQWQLERTASEAEATDYPIIELVYPVVVFDNALFEYSLESGRAEKLERRPSGIVAWPLPSRSHFAFVHLVAADSLKDWIREAKESFDQLTSDCVPELEEVGKRWESKRSTN